MGVHKHSIDARNQPLCAAAIVLVIGSKSQAERSLFQLPRSNRDLDEET